MKAQKGIEFRQVPIGELKPHPKNPRVHPDSAINKLVVSIKEFGWTNPILVSVDGYILAGHARLKAAIKAGLETVPAIFLPLKGKQAELYMLADNRLQDETDWDMPALADLLADFKDSGLDATLAGFDSNELDKIISQFAIPQQGLTPDDEIPDKVEIICKTGDLWQLGDDPKTCHRLLCGDSTKKEDVDRLMNGEKAVLMATDPPYGDSWVQKARDMHAHGYGHSRAERHGSIASDDKTGYELKQFIYDFLIAARAAGPPPFPAYVWHRAKRMLFEQAMVDAGYLIHQPIIWVKPSFVIGRLHYHPRCEWALHGWLQGGGKCSFYGERNQSDVWEISRENDKLHPTQKPVALFEIPINNHTRINEICYEPFAGSGTQFIACEKLGRRCYGLELEPRYCDVIIQRWQNFTGKKAIKID